MTKVVLSRTPTMMLYIAMLKMQVCIISESASTQTIIGTCVYAAACCMCTLNHSNK